MVDGVDKKPTDITNGAESGSELSVCDLKNGYRNQKMNGCSDETVCRDKMTAGLAGVECRLHQLEFVNSLSFQFILKYQIQIQIGVIKNLSI